MVKNRPILLKNEKGAKIMAKKRGSKGKSILLRIALLGFAIYMVYSMISLQSQLAQSKKTLSEKQNEISQRNVDIDELKSLLKNGSKDDLIERAARDKLDFVFENEEVYEDISGK